MNSNIFRLVFNKKTGQLVPVAETTSANGKGSAASPAIGAGSSPQSSSGKGLLTWSLITAAAAAAYLTIPILGSSAIAADVLPTQGQVVSGSATVNVNGRVMTVQQLSSILGVNWQSFSIGAGNKVVFQQPNAASVAINRVIGNNRSEIYGNLQANGQVFLLNQNGVLFGKGSEVSVGGLVASTAADATRNAKGQWQLTGGGSNSVINQGNIKAADSGYVVLAGGQASNEGNITANQGAVALASGTNVTLTLDNASLLGVKVDESTLNALAQNKGLIQADGGAVYLTAAGRNTLLNTVVNNDGLIQARSLGMKNGQVVLMAEGGDAVTAGVIDVSGQNAGEKGGVVAIGGNRVGVFGNASIDASGVAGGGRVIIGGDSLGKASDVASIGFADNTVIDSATNLKVGSAQGDGGFVETSGKKLSMLGRVDGQAAGKNGEWLIDPTDVTIAAVATTNATQVTGNWTVTGDTATVNLSSVNSAINAGTNVSITTNSSGAGNGDITLNGSIQKSAGARSSLTLTADRSVAVNGNILDTSTGPLDVTINATQSTQGNVTLANYITIGTNGTTAINVPRGFVATGANADVLNAGSGSITITATTNVSNQSVISGGVLNTYGNVTLTGTSAATTGNATGVSLYGINVLGTGGGTTKLTGTGSGYGAGVQINTNTTAVSGDVLNITGRGDVYTGVNIFGNVTGNVNYAGTSYYSRAFLLNTGTKLDATNNGTMSGNITFASNVVGRTVFAGNVSVTGNVSIQNYGNGTNGGNAKGVDFTNATVSVNNGTLSLIGANYYSDGRASVGIDLTNANLTVGSNASLLVVQAVSKSATSSNASSAGILMNGTTVTGNLTVSQAQDIVMNGTNTLNANGGAQSIRSTNGTLSVSGVTNTNGSVVMSDTAGLNITGLINITGGTTTLSSNASSMSVGNITGAGKLALGEGVSNGNITQLAGSTLNMTGVTAINTGTSNVSLTNSGNNFAGGLSASAVGNLSVASNTAIALANITASGGLTVNTSASNSNITQAAGSNLTVAGSTSLSAGTGNVTLTNSNNSLTGQVSVSNATTVNVVNNMAMNVGAVSTTGDLELSTKTGNLTLNGNLVSTGGNVTVSAGTASAVANTSVANGNVTGGDVIKGTATSVAAGTGKTVTLYSGNANTASLAALVTNGTTSQNKAFATAAGTGSSNVSRALNVFYRVSPTLTISGAVAQNKIYDGTSAAIVNGTVAGGIDGDVVNTSVIGTFADKNVGSNKSIALALVSAPTSNTNLSIANYTITAPPVLSGNITAATLAVNGLTASNKTYDGNTNATLGGTAAVSGFGSDVVSVIGTSTGLFSDKNAGTNKTVTVSGLTLTGADAGNYVLGQPTNLTANITQAAVTITAGAQTKTYDGTTNVSNTSAYTTSGVIAGESITATLAYTDKNAGSANKTIAVSGATAGANTSLSNYNVSYTNNTASTINKANITAISGVTLSNKVYDGTTNASFNASAATFTGKVAGDTLTLTGGTGGFASKNVGNNINVSVTNMTLGGADAGNYNVTGGTPSFNGTANITAAAVMITANAQTKTYDGTTNVSNTSAYTTAGVVAGESITASLAYTDKNAGAANKTIAVSGATAGANTSLSNYNVSYTNNTASTINKASLTATVNNDAKFVTQTDNTSYSGISYVGFVSGDNAGTAITGATISRTNSGIESAGTYNGVLTASNISSTNYNITVQAGNFTIVPADQLLVRVTNTNATYGSTPNLTVSSAQYMNASNVISNLTLSSHSGNSYSYTDGVGGQANFTLSPLNSTASSSGNTIVGAYQLGAANVTTVNATNFNSNLTVVGALTIDKANISSVTGITAASKIYDGTTNATLNTSAATFNGKIAGDSLNVASAIGAFSDSAVGVGKAVSISGIALGGVDAANYQLISSTSATTANISASTVTPPTTPTTTVDTGYLVSTSATKLNATGNSSLSDFVPITPQTASYKKGAASIVAINKGGISLPAYIPLYSDDTDVLREIN